MRGGTGEHFTPVQARAAQVFMMRSAASVDTAKKVQPPPQFRTSIRSTDERRGALRGTAAEN